MIRAPYPSGTVAHEQWRRRHWDGDHLARSGQRTQARARDIDWRARYRADVTEARRAGDHEVARDLIRLGHLLNARAMRIADAQRSLDSAKELQARDTATYERVAAGLLAESEVSDA